MVTSETRAKPTGAAADKVKLVQLGRMLSNTMNVLEIDAGELSRRTKLELSYSQIIMIMDGLDRFVTKDMVRKLADALQLSGRPRTDMLGLISRDETRIERAQLREKVRALRDLDGQRFKAIIRETGITRKDLDELIGDKIANRHPFIAFTDQDYKQRRVSGMARQGLGDDEISRRTELPLATVKRILSAEVHEVHETSALIAHMNENGKSAKQIAIALDISRKRIKEILKIERDYSGQRLQQLKAMLKRDNVGQFLGEGF